MRYGNFRNPFGLVARMLLSGQRAAYAALFRASAELAATPLDMLLKMVHEPLTPPKTNIHLPLILIVGPPRAGTTLVYQYLAQSLDVTYPSNLNSLFPRSIVHRRTHSRSTPLRLRNYFGQTTRWNEPNDGFHIWNRWLGDDRYRAKTELSEHDVRSIQQFFTAWTHDAKRPFINKNNRNCHCLSLLAETLPQARFVVVNRNPTAIVRSLIRARRTVQGDEKIGWGLLSQESHAAEPLGYVRDVCEQVVNVNRLLSEQCSEVDTGRQFHVGYEQFCRSPLALAEWLACEIPAVRIKDNAIEPIRRLAASPGRPLTDEEEQIIAGYFVN